MTNWIETAGGTLPPSCLDVLLYVVEVNSDGKTLSSDEIISGFYTDEEEKWAYTYIDEGGEFQWKSFEETPSLKVVAWTLPPERFDYEKYRKEREQFNLSLFRK